MRDNFLNELKRDFPNQRVFNTLMQKELLPMMHFPHHFPHAEKKNRFFVNLKC
jgi:hypothetical protein